MISFNALMPLHNVRKYLGIGDSVPGMMARSRGCSLSFTSDSLRRVGAVTNAPKPSEALKNLPTRNVGKY